MHPSKECASEAIRGLSVRTLWICLLALDPQDIMVMMWIVIITTSTKHRIVFMYGTPFATTEIQPGKLKTNKQINVGLKSEENLLICIANVQLTRMIVGKSI